MSSAGKESSCNAGNLGSIPGLGRSPGEEKGYPLQYSCLENPMDGGAWWATVHRVVKSETRLGDLTFENVNDSTCRRFDLYLLSLTMERGGDEPRDSGGQWPLGSGMGGKWILSCSLQKKLSK